MAAVCGELLPLGWTHAGEVLGELSPWGKEREQGQDS